MTEPATRLFAEALLLSEQERSELAAKLIETLDSSEGEPDTETAWNAEIRRRVEELDRGTVSTISWPEARRLIMDDTDDPAES
jgi:putative addiction module component (TIGR02574 family)